MTKRELRCSALALGLGLGAGLVIGQRVLRAPVAPAAAGPVAGVTAGPTPAVPGGATPALPAAPGTGPDTDPAPHIPTPAEARSALERWLAAGSPADQLAEVYSNLEHWAKADATGALQFVAGAPRFPQRTNALAIPLAQIARGNAATAVAWIIAHLDPADRRTTTEAVVARIANDSPAQAVELTLHPDIPVEPYWTAEIVGALIRTRPQDALACFARLNKQARDFAVGPLVSGWYEVDPAAAVQWCTTQRDTEHFQNAARSLLQTTSEKHPGDFEALVKQLQLSPADLAAIGQNLDWRSTDQALVFLPFLGAEDASRVMSSVLDEQLPLDPAGAVKFARDVLSGEAAESLIGTAWGSWLISDRKAALAWAETVADPKLRATLDGALQTQVATSEPQRFLTEYAGTAKPELITMAVNGLAQKDAAAAAKWVSANLAHATGSSVSDVASQWLSLDPPAAFAWVQTLPPGKLQDRALRSAVEHWADKHEYDLATQALNTISDPQRQLAMRMRVFTSMRDQDQAAARRWLDAQPINPEVRASWIAISNELMSGDPGD